MDFASHGFSHEQLHYYLQRINAAGGFGGGEVGDRRVGAKVAERGAGVY